MKKVEFTKDWKYSDDGYTIKNVKSGDVLEVTDETFKAAEECDVIKFSKKGNTGAPSNKATGPDKNK
jgi:hypothetical protein